MAALCAVTLLGVADAASVVMTEDNFDAEVFDSGKNVFVKFAAPWCVPHEEDQGGVISDLI
jgi:thioredoxin-like negative regulator of GroEL